MHMEKFAVSGACRKLLRKLYKRHYIGGKHTEEKNVLRATRHLPKAEQKIFAEDWEWCKQQELVYVLLKTGEPHVSINPEKIREINELIGRGNEGETDE